MKPSLWCHCVGRPVSSRERGILNFEFSGRRWLLGCHALLSNLTRIFMPSRSKSTSHYRKDTINHWISGLGNFTLSHDSLYSVFCRPCGLCVQQSLHHSIRSKKAFNVVGGHSFVPFQPTYVPFIGWGGLRASLLCTFFFKFEGQRVHVDFKQCRTERSPVPPVSGDDPQLLRCCPLCSYVDRLWRKPSRAEKGSVCMLQYDGKYSGSMYCIEC